MILVPGARIDRYELIAPIGDGGMAQVWVAKHAGPHAFRKLFAFKVIHPRFAEEPAFRQMFLDEARIASIVEHPNVAQVYDLGEQSGVLFLAMEYVDGESAASLQRAQGGGPLPFDVATKIVSEMCAGLHAAHTLRDSSGASHGIVHRDVSPQNVLVSVKGQVKVIDFGIALARDRAASATGAGTLKGKLNYMAPEQALQKELGPTADVFGAGATLYKLLTGRAPFDGGSEAATLRLLLEGVRPAPLPADLPEALDEIVERALAAAPHDRFASALEMQQALEAVLTAEGRAPDVGDFAARNLSAKARERRAELASVAEAPPTMQRPLPEADPPRPAIAVAGGAATGEASELAPVSQDTHTPGFMDVGALVRNAREAPEASPPAAPPEAPRREPPHEEAALPRAPEPLRAPAAPKAAAPAPSPKRAPREGAKVATARDAAPPIASGRATKIAAGVGAVVVLVVLVLVLLPFIVKARLVTDARRAGITLTIDKVGVGTSGITLRGVTARAKSAPGIELAAREILTEGFSARSIAVVGAEITIRETPAELAVDLGLAQGEIQKFLGEVPRHVVVTGGRIAWPNVAGEGTRLDASDVGVDATWGGGASRPASIQLGRFEIKTSRGTLGPWGASLDREGERLRARLLFDPALADGPNALLVWTGGSLTRAAIKVPRVGAARLGIPFEALGLDRALASSEIEIALEGERTPAGKIFGSGKAIAYGARVTGVSGPVDLTLKGSAGGTPGKALDLYETTVALGPFVAEVHGTLTPTDAGFRLDGTWKSAPIACDKLAKAEVSSWGPLAESLHEIGRATGAVRVVGKAYATGGVTFDTASPWDASVTVTTKQTCGVSLFGL